MLGASERLCSEAGLLEQPANRHFVGHCARGQSAPGGLTLIAQPGWDTHHFQHDPLAGTS